MPDGGSLFTSRSPSVNRLIPGEQSTRQIRDIVRALASPLPNAFIDTADGRFDINAVDHNVPRDIEDFLAGRTDFGLHQVDTTWYVKARDGLLRVVSGESLTDEVQTHD